MGLNAQALHDELLAQRVDGARHNSDICPFCNGDAAKSLASVPSGDEPSGAAATTTTPTTEGGTHSMSDTISKETHEALLAKAVSDATSTTEGALSRKTAEAAELATAKAALETELATLKDETTRLNRELDKAQVDLKSAVDEAASLKADIAAKDEAARLSEVASQRTEQVRNLKLFPDEYIGEKASAWAALSDTDWTDRIDEWSKARPADSGAAAKATETASAMTGTTGQLTKDVDSASDSKTTPARRSVLGLS